MLCIMFKKTLSIIVFILVAFTGYLLFNTFNFKSKQVDFAPIAEISISDSAIHHLSEAIKIKTVSHENQVDFDSTQFMDFKAFLTSTYPLVEQNLTKEIINQYSFLYTWKGTDSNLKPIILAAHLDVVPVGDEDLNSWSAPPFSGEIKNELIWGRGTMDDKIGVIGILEAVEHLLADGYQPSRTIYLAFGHDEEIGGLHGAKAIVSHLQSNGIEPEFVLDEGFSITQGLVPGVLTDVALIGIAEKGFASLTLSATMAGGHSSMPNAETAIEVLARAITQLEANPFPPELSAPVQQFIEYVGPEMRFQQKLAFANKGLFSSVILGIYQQSAPGRAVVQTTMVPTIFNAGVKDNIIPSSASATINFRILPGTSIEQVIARVSGIINDDRIQISLKDFHSEASKVSSTSSAGFSIISQSIKEVFPTVITVPNLVIAATDGRYYGAICDNVYRFLPIRLNQDNITAIHGIDEKIPIKEYKDAIRFYIQLIRNCD